MDVEEDGDDGCEYGGSMTCGGRRCVSADNGGGAVVAVEVIFIEKTVVNDGVPWESAKLISVFQR